MRNALACVGKKDRPIVTAALRTAFDQDTLADSKEHWTKLNKPCLSGCHPYPLHLGCSQSPE